MNKKIATELALGIILIIAFIAGGFIWLDSRQEKRQIQPPVLTPTPVAEQPAVTAPQPVAVANETASWKTYKNDKYGFELIFPETWQGYKVSEPGNDGTLCFSIPKSGSQTFCIFQMYVFPKNKPIPSALKLIGQTDEWKIAISSGEVGSCVQFDDFQCARSKEVSEILKTLKAE